MAPAGQVLQPSAWFKMERKSISQETFSFARFAAPATSARQRLVLLKDWNKIPAGVSRQSKHADFVVTAGEELSSGR